MTVKDDNEKKPDAEKPMTFEEMCTSVTTKVQKGGSAKPKHNPLTTKQIGDFIDFKKLDVLVNMYEEKRDLKVPTAPVRTGLLSVEQFSPIFKKAFAEIDSEPGMKDIKLYLKNERYENVRVVIQRKKGQDPLKPVDFYLDDRRWVVAKAEEYKAKLAAQREEAGEEVPEEDGAKSE